MTRTIREWYFGEEDEEQIKSYAKDISIFFKIKGYDPKIDNFDCFFDSLEEFDFIPCIREALDNADEDYDLQEVIDCLESVYDPSVSVSLEWLEKYVKNSPTETVRGMVENLVDFYSYDTDDLLGFIFSCGDDVKEKFVNWLTK